MLKGKLAPRGQRFASRGLDADEREAARGNLLRDYFSQLLNLIHSNSGSAKGRREQWARLGIQIRGEERLS